MRILTDRQLQRLLGDARMAGWDAGRQSVAYTEGHHSCPTGKRALQPHSHCEDCGKCLFESREISSRRGVADYGAYCLGCGGP